MRYCNHGIEWDIRLQNNYTASYCLFVAAFEGGANLRLRPAAAVAHLRRAMLQGSDEPRGRGGRLPGGEISELCEFAVAIGIDDVRKISRC